MRFLCALVGMSAGAGVAVFIINRWLLHLVDGPAKSAVIITTAGWLTLVPAALGWAFPSWGASSVPLLLVGVFALGEARRLYLRHGARTSGPVEEMHHPDRGGWTRPFTTTALSMLRYRVEVPNLPVPRLRIAHVSDFHVSPALPGDYFTSVMERVASTKPDLLLMTGDFVSKAESLASLRKILHGAAGLARCGAFAVLGNHDYWSGAEAVAAALREAGIVRLHDQVVTLPLGPGGRQVRLCGDERPWGPPGLWREQSACDDVTIVLTHTPDNIYRLSRERAQLVFAGHYHAGQIRLPLLGPLVVPSAFGRRWDHGHFLVGRTHLFVTAGIGAGSPAFRVYCPPDFFVVDLENAARIAATGDTSR